MPSCFRCSWLLGKEFIIDLLLALAFCLSSSQNIYIHKLDSLYSKGAAIAVVNDSCASLEYTVCFGIWKCAQTTCEYAALPVGTYVTTDMGTSTCDGEVSSIFEVIFQGGPPYGGYAWAFLLGSFSLLCGVITLLMSLFLSPSRGKVCKGMLCLLILEKLAMLSALLLATVESITQLAGTPVQPYGVALQAVLLLCFVLESVWEFYWLGLVWVRSLASRRLRNPQFNGLMFAFEE